MIASAMRQANFTFHSNYNEARMTTFEAQYCFHNHCSDWFHEDAPYNNQIEIMLWTFWKEEKNITQFDLF